MCEVNKPAKNTDTEIWRRIPDDYYSPSIHVTINGDIGINVGGSVLVAPVERWHAAGESAFCVEEKDTAGRVLTVWANGDVMVWGAADAFIAQEDEDYIATIPLNDARRIVACVNACAGLDTAALERAGEGAVLTLAAAAKTVAYETGGPDGEPLTTAEQIALGMLRAALAPFKDAQYVAGQRDALRAAAQAQSEEVQLNWLSPLEIEGLRRQVADECAKIAEGFDESVPTEQADDGTGTVWMDGPEIAAAIRERFDCQRQRALGLDEAEQPGR